MTENKPKVEIAIPTKNRYEFLALLLHSIANQTYQNFNILIVDDSEPSFNLMEIPFIAPILKFIQYNNHDWRVVFGPKKGPHASHQVILNDAKANLVLRVDDDCVMNYDCLEQLVKVMVEQEHVGAVGGLVLNSNIPANQQVMPEDWQSNNDYSGKVWEDENGNPMHSPGLQWKMHANDTIKPVEHLHSSFLYRRAAMLSVGGWAEMINVLSKKGHTEETWATYKLKLMGWNQYVNPKAMFWHLWSPVGGIRSDKSANQVDLWQKDTNCFNEWYKNSKNLF